MPLRWTVIVGVIAIAFLIADRAQSVPQTGKSMGPETIIVPPDEPEADDSEPIEPDSPDAEEESASDNTGPPPVVEYDVSKLPPPVRRLREQIIEAAMTGDIEKLRPIIEANEEPPVVSFTEIKDTIEHLKSLAGDPEGREILAILIEVLDAGYVHVDVGTPEEMYIWPYFARYPLDALTGPQMVELFKILTAGDYEDMKIYGTYLFYRVGITPKGVWKYFVAGD